MWDAWELSTVNPGDCMKCGMEGADLKVCAVCGVRTCPYCMGQASPSDPTPLCPSWVSHCYRAYVPKTANHFP